MNRTEYRNDVKSMAEEIVTEHGTRPARWLDAVHESVDSSEWIIYDANHEIVLNATRNYPDNSEVRAMSGNNATWQDMRRTAAYLAMYADVTDECQKLAEDYFVCECCKKLTHNEEEATEQYNLCLACAEKEEDENDEE